MIAYESIPEDQQKAELVMLLEDHLIGNELTYKSAAEEIGISSRALRRYASGERLPAEETQKKILKLISGIDVTVEEFLRILETGIATPERTEEWMRRLMKRGFSMINVGDFVRVSERWAGDKPNPAKGESGEVIYIQPGIQSAFNVEYLHYTIRTPQGKHIGMYQYALDRLDQTPENAALEERLKQSNHN